MYVCMCVVECALKTTKKSYSYNHLQTAMLLLSVCQCNKKDNNAMQPKFTIFPIHTHILCMCKM